MSPTRKIFLFVALPLVLIFAFVGYLAWPKSEQATPSPEKPGKETDKDTSQQYNWSVMNQGPYGDKISFATSTNLLNWADSGQILAEHASVPEAIYNEKTGTISVYFVDVSVDGKPEQLGLIKSSDNGKTWSGKQIITIEGIGDKVAVDPDPYLLVDGRIRLFFFDINDTRTPGNSGKIYSALSDDGVNFVLEQGIRLERQEGLFDPDVIHVDDTWYMYIGDGTGQTTIVATSTDGLTFTEKGVAYTGGSIPNVFYDGKQFLLYTGGIDISTSTDGLKFTKTSNRFESSYGLTADPGVIQLGPNNYLMVFKTKTAKPQN
ncbi:hypothetical protein A3A71_00005 [Candidatus Berkelbacteria bacterium RIFCSPLOWO2_01_FULL_50_28]|uniref:Glycosyl hydrolase family 32 N-terminal domain-containing protein n=1 Tax=Candidatus Berkelbacteria bacterium RIFCSPLOWO2_01_FULL_50_28 TaxID=1797471 RepID=A0A1F5EAY0_9BACT|nr:MAG: hypothetical protein A2807_03290 [Candidatus Berkelbacteria bacterium RIFCSPHIGHO2_01_FULL_50_36]OGD62423.1 MAG: hypothetical protein A3F39_01825 [Candidatus Berkelbacteria bacterium RIFCSPHIGHO2_12_FULL_50_11]OGD64436.1 MAG: hypothetical protein A3A71_00005 [Candidatus Berkelbacteria bacterium RIFCSPLOWO2_01_FULL_50_28]